MVAASRLPSIGRRSSRPVKKPQSLATRWWIHRKGGGVRPSPGAATLAVRARAASPETAGSSGNAAPGDGRTPE